MDPVWLQSIFSGIAGGGLVFVGQILYQEFNRRREAAGDRKALLSLLEIELYRNTTNLEQYKDRPRLREKPLEFCFSNAFWFESRRRLIDVLSPQEFQAIADHYYTVQVAREMHVASSTEERTDLQEITDVYYEASIEDELITNYDELRNVIFSKYVDSPRELKASDPTGSEES